MITLMFCLAIPTSWGQEYIHSLDGIEWVKIESKGRIVVKTHASKQLLIKSNYENKVSEKTKGLELIGTGKDNTSIGFYVMEEENNLIVSNLRHANSPTVEIYLPSDQNISVQSTAFNDIEISGFSKEIEASSKRQGNITITDVSGPITANSNNGFITVVFEAVSQSSPISLTTATGDLDVTIPKDTRANVSLNSTMGEIYTNFKLTIPDKDGLKTISAQKVKGFINKGGVQIQLNSVTGNIYLREH